MFKNNISEYAYICCWILLEIMNIMVNFKNVLETWPCAFPPDNRNQLDYNISGFEAHLNRDCSFQMYTTNKLHMPLK